MSLRKIYLTSSNANLSDEEENLLADIRLDYISNYLWSRESISFSKFSYEANSNISLMQNEIIRTILFKWAKKGGYSNILRKFAQKKKIILTTHKSLGDVIDVGSNEYNALLIMKFVYKVSLAIPRIKIRVYDEGDCLYCPIVVQDGKATPDYETIQSILIQVAEGVVPMRESKMSFLAKLIADRKTRKYAHLEMSMFLRVLMDVGVLSPRGHFCDDYYDLLCSQKTEEIAEELLNFLEDELSYVERCYKDLDYFPL